MTGDDLLTAEPRDALGSQCEVTEATMRVYSAAEAIGPAWEHTTELLWRPRRWGTLLKVALVAAFAQAGNSFSTNLPANISNRHDVSSPAAVKTAMLGFILFFGLIGLAVALVFLYLGARLQFVLFELVARRQTTVTPAWRYHGGRTWRWLGAKLPFLLALFGALLPLTFVFVRYNAHHQPDPAHPFAIFAVLLPVLGEVFAIAFVVQLLQMLLHDFGLPSMALEDTGIGETYRRVIGLVMAEPGQIILYLLLRTVVGLACATVGYVAVALATFVSALPLTIIGMAVWFPLHHSPVGSVIAWVVIGVLAGVLLLWYLLLLLVMLGTVFTFYQAWALYFLGGRYPLLGNLLEPPYAVPVWTPPPSLPTDGDDSSGPDLPLNAAPA